jgi:hypothetical protein
MNAAGYPWKGPLQWRDAHHQVGLQVLYRNDLYSQAHLNPENLTVALHYGNKSSLKGARADPVALGPQKRHLWPLEEMELLTSVGEICLAVK